LNVLKRGGHVILWDISDEALDTVKEGFQAQFPSATIITQVVDVSDRETVIESKDELMNDLLEDGKKISILVNNAGVVSGDHQPSNSQ